MFRSPIVVLHERILNESDKNILRWRVAREYSILCMNQVVDILPLKGRIITADIKSAGNIHTTVYCVEQHPVFFLYCGKLFPTVNTSSRYPRMAAAFTIENDYARTFLRDSDVELQRAVIEYGVNSNPHGDIECGAPVFINTVNSLEPLAVGQAVLSSIDMEKSKLWDCCIEVLHKQNDALSRFRCFSTDADQDDEADGGNEAEVDLSRSMTFSSSHLADQEPQPLDREWLRSVMSSQSQIANQRAESRARENSSVEFNQNLQDPANCEPSTNNPFLTTNRETAGDRTSSLMERKSSNNSNITKWTPTNLTKTKNVSSFAPKKKTYRCTPVDSGYHPVEVYSSAGHTNSFETTSSSEQGNSSNTMENEDQTGSQVPTELTTEITTEDYLLNLGLRVSPQTDDDDEIVTVLTENLEATRLNREHDVKNTMNGITSKNGSKTEGNSQTLKRLPNNEALATSSATRNETSLLTTENGSVPSKARNVPLPSTTANGLTPSTPSERILKKPTSKGLPSSSATLNGSGLLTAKNEKIASGTKNWPTSSTVRNEQFPSTSKNLQTSSATVNWPTSSSDKNEPHLSEDENAVVIVNSQSVLVEAKDRSTSLENNSRPGWSVTENGPTLSASRNRLFPSTAKNLPTSPATLNGSKLSTAKNLPTSPATLNEPKLSTAKNLPTSSATLNGPKLSTAKNLPTSSATLNGQKLSTAKILPTSSATLNGQKLSTAKILPISSATLNGPKLSTAKILPIPSATLNGPRLSTAKVLPISSATLNGSRLSTAKNLPTSSATLNGSKFLTAKNEKTASDTENLPTSSASASWPTLSPAKNEQTVPVCKNDKTTSVTTESVLTEAESREASLEDKNSLGLSAAEDESISTSKKKRKKHKNKSTLSAATNESVSPTDETESILSNNENQSNIGDVGATKLLTKREDKPKVEKAKKPVPENNSPLLSLMTKTSGWFEDDTSEEEKPPRTEKEIMDELLMYCFLKTMSSEFRHVKFPMLVSTFHKLYLIPACPSGKTLDIRKSSFKKMSKFISSLQKFKFIETRESTGVLNILRADFHHQTVVDFVDPFAGVVSSEPSTSFMRSGAEPIVIQRYRVSDSVLAVFREFLLKKDDILSLNEAKRYVYEYLKKKKLFIPGKQSEVRLDQTLKSIISSSAPDSMSASEIVTRVVHKLDRAFTIDVPGSEKAIENKPVKINHINFRIGKKMGSKVVTIVENLKVHGIDLDEFLKECRRGAGAGACIDDTRNGARGSDVVIQGNQIHFLEDLLTEKYKIPKRLLSGLHLAPKRKNKSSKKQ